MKECTHCHEVKLLSEFGKQASSKNGVCSWCKKCKTEATKKWNKENKARRHQYMAEYRVKKAQEHKTLAQKQFLSEMLEFQKDVLGGYKIAILNHVRGKEMKYNVVRTDGRVFCTNNKGEFLSFLEKRI